MVSKMKIELIALVVICLLSLTVQGQDSPDQKNTFWENVYFGGGFGLSFGDDDFQLAVSPSAIYRPNEYVAYGPGLLFSYQDNDFFTSTLYGISGIFLVNPIPEIQLSAEVEQLFGNRSGNNNFVIEDEDINNTALFLGGGYNFNGVSVGVRYNVLFDEDDGVFAQAWQPFVRVYF